MASARVDSPSPAPPIAFTVERVRLDEMHGQCLIAGADDEAEPAGYFIIDLDDFGPTVEFLDETFAQRDGVAALEIGSHHLAFAFDASSPIGARMQAVRVTSTEAIGAAVRSRLGVAFAGRVRDA